MKVVLVNPPLTILDRYGVHFRSGGEIPPIGLAYLAAVLLKNSIDVRIIDGSLSTSYEQLVREIIDEQPDYVGLTSSTMSIHNAGKVAKMVKEANPSITIIVGGPHITTVSHKTMELFPSFDIGVIGEAERTLPELLLAGKTNLKRVDGVVFRDGNSLTTTAKREFITDLDSLPKPAWRLLPDLAKTYCPPVHTVKHLPAAYLVTSRGCRGKCTFCDRSVFGDVIRANSAEYVLRLMEELHYEFGINGFQFGEDNFLLFRSRLLKLCALLSKSEMNVTWSIAGRIDMVNPRVLNLLKEAGCWQIWYGIESGSQRVLDVLQKGTKIEQIRNAVHWTKEAGISAGGFFILGLPTETEEDREATIRFSRALELDGAQFCLFTPLPGSAIYDTAPQYGEFDADWRKASRFAPVFIPNGITKKQLMWDWKRASVGFYLRPRIIWWFIRIMRSPRHISVYVSGLLALIEATLFRR